LVGIVAITVLTALDKTTVEIVGGITALIAVYTGGRSYVKGNGKGA